MRRCTTTNIGIWPMRGLRSASSWKRFTTESACTRLWVMYRPPSLRHNWRRKAWKPLRGNFLREFSEAWEIYRSDVGLEKTPGQKLSPPRRPSASMSCGWLFLGGLVSTRARLRFTNRGQCAVNSVLRSSILQRTANYLLTVCPTPGGKCTVTFTEDQICGSKFLREFRSACRKMSPLVEFTTKALGLKY